MDGLRIEIDLDGLRQFAQQIGEIAAAGDDTHQLMDDIGAYGVASTQERFVTAKSPDGQKWQPSGRVKMAQGNAQTLVDRGHLRDSFSSLATSHSAIWGTNLIYAAPNQFGATIRPKNGKSLKFKIPGLGFRSAQEVVLPARPFMGVNDVDAEEIGKMVGAHFLGGSS